MKRTLCRFGLVGRDQPAQRVATALREDWRHASGVQAGFGPLPGADVGGDLGAHRGDLGDPASARGTFGDRK